MALDSLSSITSRDIQLMQRVSQRDQHALLELYQYYGSLVYGMAIKVLRTQVLAEEITQDVFMKIWRQPDRWNPNLGQCSTWLLTLTRNAAIDRLRKEQRQPLKSSTPIEFLPPEKHATASVDEGRWHDGQLLRTLMSELPPEQLHLVELAFYQGFTHSELAELLNLPLGTVKTRLRLGLQRLRKLWMDATEPDRS
ncbi:MAG: sigma-70 family RNA polymerase sigma factor [Caldilineaceae bacterium]